ncbi:MAG TPA: hypothetical protein VEF76_05740 [Patescibacteria group bacterium]|nr:hypothetical protein [Patescibacteria group bacterium]
MAIRNEIDVVGQWIESMADLVEKYANDAGSNRARVITYDRATVTGLGRAFKAAAEDSRFIPDAERVRAARHVYVMQEETRWGIGAGRLEKLAGAGIGTSLQQAAGAPDMLAAMTRLFEVCRLHGVGMALENPEPGLFTISLTPVPEPRPVLKPKPPKMKFAKGF